MSEQDERMDASVVGEERGRITQGHMRAKMSDAVRAEIARHRLGGEERVKPCPGCGAEMEQVRFGGEDKPWVPERCGQCLKKQEIELAARVTGQSIATSPADRRVAALHMPRQYAALEIADFDPTVMGEADRDTTQLLGNKKMMAEAFVALYPERIQLADYPFVVVMRGGVGVGKTMLAWCIAKALVREYEATVVVATMADIVRDLRESWRRESEGPSERGRLKPYRQADLLVIDEVSRHAMYGEPTQHLYDLVAPREADYRPTILTTNEDATEFERLVGPAFTSRGAGSGGIWEFGDLDYRAIRASRRVSFLDRASRLAR